MNYFTFSVAAPCRFYMGGEFQTKRPWKHQQLISGGDFKILLCIKGPVYIQMEDIHYTLHENDVLLIPPYTRHEGYQESPAGADFYWLHFFTESPPQKNCKAPEQTVSAFIQQHLAAGNQITLPTLFDLQEAQGVISSLHNLLAIKPQAMLVEERDYLTTAFLIQLFNSFAKNFPQPSDTAQINTIKEWIRTNMSADLNVAVVAKNFHMNRDYLTRIFKKATGLTILQYIAHQRIEVACILLTRTNLSVSEVAYHSYFNDPKMMMKKFKATTGLTPKNYRTKHRDIFINTPEIDPMIPVPKELSDMIYQEYHHPIE